MPKINIKTSTSTSVDLTYEKVKSFLTSNDDIRKFDPSLQLSFDDHKKTGQAMGKVFSASIQVTEQAPGCEVALIIDLPLKLALMKGLIEKTLHSKLKQALS